MVCFSFSWFPAATIAALWHRVQSRHSPGRSGPVKRKAEAPAGKRPWQLDPAPAEALACPPEGRGRGWIEGEGERMDDWQHAVPASGPGRGPPAARREKRAKCLGMAAACGHTVVDPIGLKPFGARQGEGQASWRLTRERRGHP